MGTRCGYLTLVNFLSLWLSGNSYNLIDAKSVKCNSFEDLQGAKFGYV